MEEKEKLEELLETMIEVQLKRRGIDNGRVLEAIRDIKRHLFVPSEFITLAYSDRPLPVGEGQTISQPYMVALMTQLLDPQPQQRILEIGTGSGWQAALLSKLCKEVITVERISSLADRARFLFRELGLVNVYVKEGDGSQGWILDAPYDGIIVTCASPSIPPPLVDQLKEGGKIVIPVGSRFSHDLIVEVKKGRILQRQNFGGCIFVPLIGKYGFQQ